jgi:FAD:protein FMN transferase
MTHNNPRRQWLRCSLGIGAALAGVAASPGQAAPGHLRWAERALLGFGTTLWLRAAHREAETIERALDAAVQAIRHVETQMSLFDPSSAVSRLNRDGELRRPDADLLRVLRLAQHVAERSDGAFDITVQPLWRAWEAARRAGRDPTPQELSAAGVGSRSAPAGFGCVARAWPSR